MKVGDKVVKNTETWKPNQFDDWGRGIGVGFIYNPQSELEEGTVYVKWATGFSIEKINEIKLYKPFINK